MFEFVKQIFVSDLMLFSCNLSNVNPWKCVSMSNQERKVRTEIINVNSDEPSFYRYGFKISKLSGSCNNTNDTFAKMCIPGVVKNINLKVFNLTSRTNKTRYTKLHETCKCKCRLDASVCNNKRRWNEDKYRCECKELIDEGSCHKGFFWNPSNCECGYDKACDAGEYLDYANCKCRTKWVQKLVEECTENIDDVKLERITLAKHENMCRCSCTPYIALFSVLSTINIGIGTSFVYYKYMNHETKSSIFQTKIYWTY